MKPFRNNLPPKFVVTCASSVISLFQFINGRSRLPRGLKVWVCGHSLSVLAGSNPAGVINISSCDLKVRHLRCVRMIMIQDKSIYIYIQSTQQIT